MAFAVNEADDDAARTEQAVVKALAIPVKHLREMGLAKGSAEWRFIESLDVMLNVFRQMPAPEEVKRLKEIAWKYRRRLPRNVAPKLPPHDPAVQQMEDADG